MRRHALLLLSGLMSLNVSMATDRSIAVPAKVAMSWGYLTNSTAVKPSRTPGVGFWQRASGAKPGVGEVFVAVMEYQLPEASPARLRSATFQLSGRPAQCVGNEPVVVDVYAYMGDGRADIGDATAGSKIAQLSADCSDRAAFSRPIDVTHVVRQATVASGIRFVGFNVRKANNRQGPGLFDLSPGKLVVVLAEQDVDKRSMGQSGASPAMTVGRVAAAPGARVAATPGVVPAQWQGTWVPARGGCESPARVVVAGDRLTLENGSDSQSLGGIEMAGPGYFAPDYRGIMAVLITEFSGQQPVTATFNPSEKRGMAQVDFSPVMPGKATPMLTAYNARISKLDLARRFPLDKVLLKRCAA